MKNLSMAAATLALHSLFSTAAMAKDATLTACTKDGKTVTMHVDVEGYATPDWASGGASPVLVITPTYEELAQAAFAKAAGNTSSIDMTGRTARPSIPLALAFRNNLAASLEGMTLSPDAHLIVSTPVLHDQSCGAMGSIPTDPKP